LAILWQWPSSATYLESGLTSWATTFSNLATLRPSLFSLVESNYIRQDPPAPQSERKLTESAGERRKEGPRGPERGRERDWTQEIESNRERQRKRRGRARKRERERSEERVSVEKQSVARRREPSWRVAATNGLMNLMEAPRYRVAGEPRWRITEAKEEKRKRVSVEREKFRSPSPSSSSSSSSSSSTLLAFLILSGVGEHRNQRTVRFRRKNVEKNGGRKTAGREREGWG
jgi:hypothetical protein